jgi:60 kDa SS-A/Ro ribonucleoprotein
MVRFSLSFRSRRKAGTTLNKEQAEAFVQTPELSLAQLLLTSFIAGKHYRSAGAEFKQIKKLCARVDPLYAAKAAVYARHVYGMRSASHVAAAEVSKLMLGRDAGMGAQRAWLKDFYDVIIRRPDDMREICALVMGGAKFSAGGLGHSLPKAMQKGFRRAFMRFDEYQLGAYRGEGSGVKLVDLARLCHAKPQGAHGAALSKLIDGTLRSQKQGARLTQAGQAAASEAEKAELKQQVWHEELPRMGYNAVVLNARGILAAAPELYPQLCARLEDRVAVRASLILPLQLWKAYLALAEVPGPEARAVMSSLSVAIDLACANLPPLPGATLVVLDTSGSMTGCSSHSGPFKGQSAIAIGAAFAAMLAKGLRSDIMLFDTDARYAGYNPADSTLGLAGQLRALAVGGGTNFHAIFNRAKRHYDRIIILSDMQGWIGFHAPVESFAKYRKRYGGQPVRIYSFDLTGYGTSMFPEQGVCAVSGLNFAVFELIAQCEADPRALVHAIEAVEFTQEWVRRNSAGKQPPGENTGA